MAKSKAAKFKRYCKQGKTYKDGFYFKDKYKNPIDYSDYSARMEIRRSLPTADSTPGDTDVILTLTSADGDIVVSGNKVSITIDSQRTAALEVGSYFWELELFNSDDPPHVPTIMEPSSFVVTPEVTLND